jgi:hypothetical protein
MAKIACLLLTMGLLSAGPVLSPALAAESPPQFSPHASVGWVAILGGLKPPPSGAGPVMDDPAHPTIDNNQFRLTGRQPTLPVADLSNPILQPWVREALRKRNERVLAGEPVFGPRQSCWPRGVPGFLMEGGFQPVFIIQSAQKIVMVAQADNHQIRHIYLNVPHSRNVKPSWFGESVGHYEGDTLVIDTVGITTRTFVDDYQTPHTDKLHVVERFRLADGGKGMEVSLYVEDEGAFTTPWNAVQRYRRAEPDVAERDVPVQNDGTSAVGDAGPLQEGYCADMQTRFDFEKNEPIPQANNPDF